MYTFAFQILRDIDKICTFSQLDYIIPHYDRLLEVFNEEEYIIPKKRRISQQYVLLEDNLIFKN